MLEKLKDFGLEMEKIKAIIEKMKYLQEQKNALPFETLGRSLAYNCYTPRLNFSDLNILKMYKIVTLNPRDIENMLQNSTKLDSIKSLESSENNIIFLQDFMESTKSKNSKNTHLDSINIIDSISILRRLTPYFIAIDSITIDCYQVLAYAIAGADMFVFDYENLLEFCAILSHLDSKKLDFNRLDSNDLKAIKELSKDFATQNHAKNLAQEILNLANDLALIPIFRINSQNTLESLKEMYNIECILTSKKLENIESYINLSENFIS